MIVRKEIVRFLRLKPPSGTALLLIGTLLSGSESISTHEVQEQCLTAYDAAPSKA